MAKNNINHASRERHQWTPKKKTAFVEALAFGATVSAAARAVDMSRSGAYRLRASDPAFAAAWIQAYEESIEVLEAEAFRRAMGWVEERRDGSGRLVVCERYSDLLLMFLLKARRPEVYRDRVAAHPPRRENIVVDLIPIDAYCANCRNELNTLRKAKKICG